MSTRITYYGLLSLLLVGCGTYLPPPEGHVTPATPIAGEIPKPVALSPFLREPSPTTKQERYSVVVSEVPVKELLFALARDANLNLDLRGALTGTVTLNAIDQALPRILERVAQQVDLVFEIQRDTLVISPDTPYMHTYRVDYVNLNRETDSSVQITSQVTDASGGSGGGGGSNNSAVTVHNKSNNQFWTTLENQIRAVIGLPPGTAGGEAAPTPKAAGGDTDQDLANRPLVMANPLSGIITVRASRRHHREIQAFLDRTLAGARRQVRIEATVAEVTLNDQYQAGMDWSWMNSNGGFSTDAMRHATSQVGSFVSGALTPLGNSQPNLAMQTNLLSRFGDVKVLSTPKLVTLNNQVAILKVVDNDVFFTIEITRGTPGMAGSPAVNINGIVIPAVPAIPAVPDTYSSKVHTVPIGLTMHIIPQVSDNDEVTLIVRPTITRVLERMQDPNPALVTSSGERIVSLVPKVQVREMESILRIRNKQVAVIGGLMQDEDTSNKAGLPGLAKVPLLGNLFGLGEQSSKKTELVIFLQPTVLEETGDSVTETDYKVLETAKSRKPPIDAELKMGEIP